MDVSLTVQGLYVVLICVTRREAGVQGASERSGG
jgi:hypothetical protein